MAMGNIYGVRGSRRGIFGGLTLFIGPNQADRRHELALARIAAGNQPNRTPSAAHIAHLNRTGGTGGTSGQGTFGGGSAPPSGVIDPRESLSAESVPQVIQGNILPGGDQLFANAPPVPTTNMRKFNDSDLAAFLRRGG